MKYLKKYQLFLEFDGYEVNDGDDVDVKFSKEKLNDINKDIIQYNQNKSNIDNIFKKSKDLSKIEPELEKIVGKESDVRNEFLVEYIHVAKLHFNLNKKYDDNIKDKLKLDDFRQELSLSEDSDTKSMVNSKILDINNRISNRNKEINDLKKEIDESDKKHKDKILKVTKDIKEYIQKISSTNIK